MNVNQYCYKKLNTPSAIQKIMTSSANISFGGGWGDHLPPGKLLQAFESVFSSPSKYYESTRYSDIAGDIEFRNAVAEYENRMYGRKNLELSNVIIGQGSTELTSSLFKVLLENNDNVLLFDPSYANFRNQLTLENNTINFIEQALIDEHMEHVLNKDKKKFLIEYQRIFRENIIKLCIICNPDNPTSIIWDDEILFEMIQIASSQNTWFIIDLSYSAFYFQENMPQTYKLTPNDYPNLITIHSFSKNFSLLGFRLGYLVAQKEIIELMKFIEGSRNLSPNALVQNVLLTFLKSNEWDSIRQYSDCLRQLYREVSQYTEKLIRKKLPKAKVLKPDGGFYIVCSLEEYGIEDVNDFAEGLLENEGVLVVPGKDFGDTLQKAFRFSFAPLIRNKHKIGKGIDKIANYIGQYAMQKKALKSDRSVCDAETF
jgi:aminotransferase